MFGILSSVQLTGPGCHRLKTKGCGVSPNTGISWCCYLSPGGTLGLNTDESFHQVEVQLGRSCRCVKVTALSIASSKRSFKNFCPTCTQRCFILPQIHWLTMFIAALFITARNWKQPRCPPMIDWVKKMWSFTHLHMEYYSTTKK